MLNEPSSDECEQSLMPLSLRSVYAVLDRLAVFWLEPLDRSAVLVVVLVSVVHAVEGAAGPPPPPPVVGKLGLRLREMLGRCDGDTGRLGLRLRVAFCSTAAAAAAAMERASSGECDGDEKTEPLPPPTPPPAPPSSSKTLSMRDERRDGEWPLDDAELRRDDRLAMRPSARIALPVFYRRPSEKKQANTPTHTHDYNPCTCHPSISNYGCYPLGYFCYFSIAFVVVHTPRSYYGKPRWWLLSCMIEYGVIRERFIRVFVLKTT